MLRATAEQAMTQTGFVFDETTGMYYDHSTGFYYDSVGYVTCSLGIIFPNDITPQVSRVACGEILSFLVLFQHCFASNVSCLLRDCTLCVLLIVCISVIDLFEVTVVSFHSQ